jgi:hypothetical protein
MARTNCGGVLEEDPAIALFSTIHPIIDEESRLAGLGNHGLSTYKLVCGFAVTLQGSVPVCSFSCHVVELPDVTCFPGFSPSNCIFAPPQVVLTTMDQTRVDGKGTVTRELHLLLL